uniref:Uncharacterized protein n=1 Tax=Cannabis sativa TaxID=3483 RepID=A0A803PAI7_CANSA
MMLNALVDSYRELKTSIKYGRTSITLDEVIFALMSKDMEMRNEKPRSSGLNCTLVKASTKAKILTLIEEKAKAGGLQKDITKRLEADYKNLKTLMDASTVESKDT